MKIARIFQVNQGVSLVRPPGHHAEVDESCGFCFFNTTAIAARYAEKVYGIQKVLILDWDIHHGNGIQHIFYEDCNVLYISVHRFDNGEYFPGLREGNYDFVGNGPGNVQISVLVALSLKSGAPYHLGIPSLSFEKL